MKDTSDPIFSDADPTIRVLLVEDNPGDADLVREMLRGATALSFDVAHMTRLDEALAALRLKGADVLLLDLSLPDARGLETVRRVQEREPDVPIVVMTGNDDDSLALKTLKSGAQGYLVKGEVGTNLLVRTLHHAIERHRLMRTLEIAQEREHNLATRDQLTNLPNRPLFTDRLCQAVTSSDRSRRKVGVLLVDVDRFRRINDSFGYAIGDELLCSVAGRLGACVRRADTVARLVGNRFAVLLPNVVREIDAARVADTILSTLSKPTRLDSRSCVITGSIGIAIFPDDGQDSDDLIINAETAMYHAKERGRNRYAFYSEAMNAAADERLSLENELRRALDGGQLLLHYQPKIHVARNRIDGVEALVRWRHPERGLISPAQFIPVAEESGLIVSLGEWVLRAACRQTRAWRTHGCRPLPVAVNVSSRQFEEAGFAALVRAAMEESGLSPEDLEIEITESTLMKNVEETIDTLTVLKNMGVRLAIDDFGTGYSSLGALRSLPVDFLKIDRSFVQSIASDDVTASMVSSIIAMGHALGKEIVAEGVETLEQAELLESQGCQYMQGYLFGKPMSAESLEVRLEDPALPAEKEIGASSGPESTTVG